jgi:hypothetical protein
VKPGDGLWLSGVVNRDGYPRLETENLRVIPAEVIDAMPAALVLAKERLDIKERQLAGHRVGHMPQRVFDDLDRTANSVGVIDAALDAFDASRGGKP